jgi:hypothetical protein
MIADYKPRFVVYRQDGKYRAGLEFLEYGCDGNLRMENPLEPIVGEELAHKRGFPVLYLGRVSDANEFTVLQQTLANANRRRMKPRALRNRLRKIFFN